MRSNILMVCISTLSLEILRPLGRGLVTLADFRVHNSKEKDEIQMVKLMCALIGEKGVFYVDIDEKEPVGDLKDAIKTENPNEIKCDAGDLELYLARKGNAWLSDSEPSAEQLEQGKEDDDIKRMLNCEPLDSTWSIQDCLNEEQMPAPQLRQIHVLVVAPIVAVPRIVPQKILTISPNSNKAETVKRYETLSKTLAKQEQVESLSNAICAILEGNFEITPFVVLESSSGMGKTQMAFNLNATGKFDVFYLWVDNVDDKGQDISAAYTSRTNVFSICLNNDFELRKDLGDGMGSIRSLQGTKYLWLYRFIHAALLGKNEVDDAARSREDVEKALKDRATSGKKPFIFFLDEFPREIDRKATSSNPEAYDQKRRLRLMLNVFRSFGLVVIVSSTSGTGRNLVSVSSGTRNNLDYLWCIVHPLLPRTVIGNDIRILPTVLQDIIANSRPLFAWKAVEYMRENPWSEGSNTANYLNALVGHLARIFADMKERRYHEFIIGQLCLLLSSSYRAEDDKVNLIDSHYACLDEKTTFRLILRGNGHLYKVEGKIKADEANIEAEDRRTWKCRSVFPHPANDVLLHLTMTGGLLYRPFKQPLREVLSSVLTTTMHFHNTNQPMNDGQRLEALVSAAVVLASHVGGLGGVALPTFLGRLLYELGVRPQDVRIELPRGVETSENLVVPFLSPPNVLEWPPWLLDDKFMKFSNLVRTRNREQIDFRIVSGEISGECMDDGHPLPLNTMREILSRVPADSKVHLVVTRAMQKKYFKEGTYATFVREHNLPAMDVYRISDESTLEAIVGMENHELHKVQCMDDGSTRLCEKKLVIFIVIGTGKI
ncbi:hypothetical protein CCR75_004121 [Bremia lactucae]|uniref:Crinkler effector protein N-terminal domain-containing protein n=1 Tax=Bremia lactucae TaxID=4779 RepID=A0A976ICI5_BRELC|nr:hypothetical protein CCR75_004121 [Bremia lactucae]